MKVLLALVAGIVGAIAGAAGLGFLLAFVFTQMYGTFEGSAAMGGFTISMPLSAILGFALGLWLVLRRKAPSHGPTLGWLAACILTLIAIGAYVWEYT